MTKLKDDYLWEEFGYAKKCAQCLNKCKQHGHCIIVQCPNYELNEAYLKEIAGNYYKKIDEKFKNYKKSKRKARKSTVKKYYKNVAENYGYPCNNCEFFDNKNESCKKGYSIRLYKHYLGEIKKEYLKKHCEERKQIKINEKVRKQ